MGYELFNQINNVANMITPGFLSGRLTILIMLLVSSSLANQLVGGNIEFVSDSISVDCPFVYVVTNRPLQNDKSINEYFPNEVSKEKMLSYLKVYNNEGNWLVQDLTSMDDFKPDNKDLKNWLIYVHGDSQTTELAFTRGLQIQQEYKVNVIVFSWPSKDPNLGGIQNFNNSINQIEQGTPGFVLFLHQIETWKRSKNVEPSAHLSLFLHSLGNYYAQRMVSDSLLSDLESGLFDNIILNSAAVNQKDHHLWLDEFNIQQRIYVNSNRKDMTLKGVNLFTDFDTQLGEQAIDGFAPNAVYVNFSTALKNEKNFGLLHGYYVGVIPGKSQNIYNYYQTIFNGYVVDLSNPAMFTPNDTVPVYDIMF